MRTNFAFEVLKTGRNIVTFALMIKRTYFQPGSSHRALGQSDMVEYDIERFVIWLLAKQN